MFRTEGFAFERGWMEFNLTRGRELSGWTPNLHGNSIHAIVLGHIWGPHRIQGIMGKSTTDLIDENTGRAFRTRVRSIKLLPVDHLKRFVHANGGGPQRNQHQVASFCFEFVGSINFLKIDAPPTFVQPNLLSKRCWSDPSFLDCVFKEASEHEQVDRAFDYFNRGFSELHCTPQGRKRGPE